VAVEDLATGQAVEALRVATTLLEQYLQDLGALSAKGATAELEGRMRALDDNYLGVWLKLDQAAGSLAAAGRDVSYYRSLRAQVDTTALGFDRQDKVSVSMGGVKQRTTITVDDERVERVQEAMSSLKMLLDGVDWHVGADDEVEQFLARQRGPWRLLRTLGVLGVIGAVVGGVLLLLHWLRPPDYGELSKPIYKLQNELKVSPCDRKLAVKLAETLNQAGAHRAALDHAARFFEACGEHRRMRWATLSAHKRLKNYDGAIAEVNRLIEAVPRDRDYRFWRAELYELKGDMERAIADYRQTLALAPFLRGVGPGLAGLLRVQGRPCEGLLWLASEAHHQPRSRKRMAEKISALVKTPGCARLLGQGEALIRVGRPRAATPGAPELIPAERARLKIGVATARTYAVEPDLPYLIISARLAREAGLMTEAAEVMLLGTPDGFLDGHRLVAQRVSVGGAEAASVELVVVGSPPGGADAVLGQSLLSRFSRVSDPGTGAVKLVGADALGMSKKSRELKMVEPEAAAKEGP